MQQARSVYAALWQSPIMAKSAWPPKSFNSQVELQRSIRRGRLMCGQHTMVAHATAGLQVWGAPHRGGLALQTMAAL